MNTDTSTKTADRAPEASMTDSISARLRSYSIPILHEAADHIDAQDAKIAALVEALGRIKRICVNAQPDKISDGVKIAQDAIDLAAAKGTNQ